MAQTVTAEGVGIGWKPERADHRDYKYGEQQREHMRAIGDLPQHVDLYEFQSPVRNQMAEGSCVGHGWAAAADTVTRQDGDRWNTVYSPRFAYNQARFVESEREGTEAWKEDNGAYVRDGGMALVKYGVCPESNWKYREGDFGKKATASRIKAAHRMRLEIQRTDTLDEILNALAAGDPVVFGFMCHTGLWTREIDRTGILTMPGPRDRPDGGHCVLACGYDLQEQTLLIRNSWSEAWGSAWGHKGYGTLPFSYVTQGYADDFWAAVREA